MKVPAEFDCRKNTGIKGGTLGGKDQRYSMGVLYRKSSLLPTFTNFCDIF